MSFLIWDSSWVVVWSSLLESSKLTLNCSSSYLYHQQDISQKTRALYRSRLEPTGRHQQRLGEAKTYTMRNLHRRHAAASISQKSALSFINLFFLFFFFIPSVIEKNSPDCATVRSSFFWKRPRTVWLFWKKARLNTQETQTPLLQPPSLKRSKAVSLLMAVLFLLVLWSRKRLSRSARSIIPSTVMGKLLLLLAWTLF